MKKVIFLCLLSLSYCLSKPTDDQGKTPQQNAPVDTVDPKIQISTEKSPIETSITTEQKPVVTSTTAANNNITTEASIAPTELKTTTSQPAPNENKTKKDVEPQKESEKKVEPSKETESTTEAKAGTDKDKNNTPVKPEEKTENATVSTTEKSAVTTITTIKPTEAPKKDEDKPTLKARGFDGPSFIGGIILTLGLLAISFMGFKYYKNQTERNYHTL